MLKVLFKSGTKSKINSRIYITKKEMNLNTQKDNLS